MNVGSVEHIRHVLRGLCPTYRTSQRTSYKSATIQGNRHLLFLPDQKTLHSTKDAKQKVGCLLWLECYGEQGFEIVTPLVSP